MICAAAFVMCAFLPAAKPSVRADIVIRGTTLYDGRR